ncbi:MAG: ABC transporter substrate-binding protein [Candidatus Tectomicrobia bacterium]|nr:ABC transporter substrate-binding protein [Candidatus Tectomicrobia bacterium]
MSLLPLTLACGDYDRMRALRDGSVRAAGIDLNYLALPVEEIFLRMTKFQEFEVSEMSLSSYLILRSRDAHPFTAIPVFPSRMFRHSCIFARADRGINRPEDLKGKRVGVPEYQMTAALWIRGFLQHDYGVRPEDLQWFQGGLMQTGREEKIELHLKGIDLRHISAETTLNAMLERGDLDALLTARMPACFLQRTAPVKRLFENSKAVEQDYFKRTGIFPIMHTLVIRNDILERHPWVAANLYKAFQESKARCLEAMYFSGALPYTIPWLIPAIEEGRQVLGEDPWPYGVRASRATLEALVQYSCEQQLSARKMEVEEIFVPSTVTETTV